MTSRAAALASLLDASTPAELVAARRDLERAAGGMLAVYTDEERAALLVSRAWVVESTRWDAGELRAVDPEGELSETDAAEALAEIERADRLGAWERARVIGAYPTEAMALQAAREGIAGLRDRLLAEAPGDKIAAECLRLAADGLSLRWQPEDDPSSAQWAELVRVRRASERE